VKSVFIVSTIAWIVTAPLVIHVFHRIHLLSPLFNLFLIPVVFVLTGLLILFAFLSFLPVPVVLVLKTPIAWTAGLLTQSVSWFDRWDLFAWTLQAWSPATWIILAAGLWMFTFFKTGMARRIRLAASVLLLVNCLLFDQSLAQAQKTPYTITFFDVGQGDSIFFQFPKGGNLLVDTGRGGAADNARWVIGPYLKSQGITRIDAVLISHPQFDHCGSLATLLDSFDVGWVMDNGDRSESAFYQEILEKIDDNNVGHVTLKRGDRIAGFPDTEILILHPDPSHVGRFNVNDRSVAALVTTQGINMLLTGDLEEKGTEDFLRSRGWDKVQILKAAHHGAKVGENGIRMLRRAAPDMVVIQVGEKNRYGHPHEKTTKALEALSGTVYRTDHDGAVQMQRGSDGKMKVRRWPNDNVPPTAPNMV